MQHPANPPRAHRARRAWATTATLAAGLLLSTQPAHAGLPEAKAAYDRQDYATALKELQQPALQDDPEALVALAPMYLHGEGVPQDGERAIALLRRAADKGHAPAAEVLGFAYARGRGVPQDAALALQWLRAAQALAERTPGYQLPPQPLPGAPIAPAPALPKLTREDCPHQPAFALPVRFSSDAARMPNGTVEAELWIVDGVVKEVVILSGPVVYHEPMRRSALTYRCRPGLTLWARQLESKSISQSSGGYASDAYDITQPTPTAHANPPPFDADWAGLDAHQRAAVREAYAKLPAQDEPPYPVAGMGPLLEYTRRSAESLRVAGPVFAVAQVDAQGKAQAVNVIDSPSPELSKELAAVLGQQAYKPARCAGQPCAMAFALEATVTRKKPPQQR